MTFNGRTALVTGAASGIGKAVLLRLLEVGCNVSFCDYNKAAGEELAKELLITYGEKVLFLHCDVSDGSQFEDIFKRTKFKFSGLDIVVNNAGVLNESDNWRRMVDINLKGAIQGTKLALKHMGKDSCGSGGVVVNIGSTAIFEHIPSIPVYAATKAAISRLSYCLGHDLYYKRSGVKVICLSPGSTVTNISTNLEEAFPEEYLLHNVLAAMSNSIFQSPEHVAECLVELLDKADSGTHWVVKDGLPASQVILEARL